MAEPDDLSPEEQALVDEALRTGMRRRRILITGYLVSLAVLLLGLPTALYYIGSSGRGEWAAPVMLAPWAAAGGVMWCFGRWSRRAARRA